VSAVGDNWEQYSEFEKMTCRLHELGAIKINVEGEVSLSCELCAPKAGNSNVSLGAGQGLHAKQKPICAAQEAEIKQLRAQLNTNQPESVVELEESGMQVQSDTCPSDTHKLVNVLEENGNVKGLSLEGSTMKDLIAEWQVPQAGTERLRTGELLYTSSGVTKIEYLRKVKNVDKDGINQGKLIKTMLCAKLKEGWKCCVSKKMEPAQGIEGATTKLENEFLLW
jgi:hypothetical protein